MALDPNRGCRAVFFDGEGRAVYHCGEWQLKTSGDKTASLVVLGRVPRNVAKVSLYFKDNQPYGYGDVAIVAMLDACCLVAW